MNKKAATPVVAFLLFVGAFKMANSVFDVNHADNYTLGEMKGNDMINYFVGLKNGYYINKPSIK